MVRVVAKAITNEIEGNGKKFDRIGRMIATEEYEMEYYNSLKHQDKSWFTRRKRNGTFDPSKHIVPIIHDRETFSKLSVSEQYFLTKMQLAGKKAQATQKFNKKAAKQKNWDGEGKRSFRNWVIESFKNYGSGNVLALESKNLFFAKGLPDHMIDIYEHNIHTYKDIVKEYQKSNVSNICELHNKDIVKASEKENGFYDYAFLDFCDTFVSNEARLVKLSGVLHDSSEIAFTFSLRGNKRVMDNYKLDLIKKLQGIFKNHTFDYTESYRDGSPMIGIVLKNRNLMNH